MAPAVTEAQAPVVSRRMGRGRNPGDGRRLRVAMLAIGVAGIGAAFAPAAAIARGLPDGRAYEMVSAVDKNGGDASGALTSSPDGDRLAYYSLIGFADVPASSAVNSYVAARNANGWSTAAMQPKIGYPNLSLTGGYHVADVNDDLSESITITRSAADEPAAQNIFTTKLDGSSKWVTAPPITPPRIGDKSYSGRSADGSHIIFESDQQLSSQLTIPNASPEVWEWVNGAVRLVSILPNGTIPPNGAGTGNGTNGALGNGTAFSGTLPQPNVVSGDGSKIFFGIGGGSNIGGAQSGVYVRESGTTTRELSLSQRTGTIGQQPINGASFAGASADGNMAVFTSPDQLTNDATPNGGLYGFDLRTGVLSFLSSGATDPNGAQVEAIVGNSLTTTLVSSDGSHVYFLAQGVLVPGKGVAGGHNLYMADANGVSYIATLGNDDAQNWVSNTGNGGSITMRTTPDGRSLVFQSWEQVTNVDNGGHEEIYLYDADKDTTTCVSCGDAGHTPAGDASILSTPLPRGGFLNAIQLGRQRTLTDDGSRIFFQTTDSLVPEDVNGLADVYEYYTATGKVALISAGTGGYDSEIADNSPDGRDVFFFTRDSLVKRDIDGGGRDLYDARIGGGFADPQDTTPCADDACQPIPNTAPAAPAPLTGAPTGGTIKETRAPRLFVARITTTGRRNIVKTGRLTLVTTVESSGTVSASGRASYGNHTVYKLSSAKVTVKRAGTQNLHVSLPSAVRSRLKHHHKVKLSIDVSYNKATGPVHVAVTLS